MTVRGRHFLRARAEATANPNEDDPYVTPLDRYAPELDRAWRGEEA